MLNYDVMYIIFFKIISIQVLNYFDILLDYEIP